MSAPGSKKTKQEKRKKKKSGRNAQLLSLTCCPDSQGSHREPCHRVAFGNRPANTHTCLIDARIYVIAVMQGNGKALGR